MCVCVCLCVCACRCVRACVCVCVAYRVLSCKIYYYVIVAFNLSRVKRRNLRFARNYFRCMITSFCDSTSLSTLHSFYLFFLLPKRKEALVIIKPNMFLIKLVWC